MPLLSDVERIAVLRANGIGDLMFALPAFDSLRAAYPGARISLLAHPWHSELLSKRPSPVDEVVVIPPTKGVRDEPGVREDANEQEEFFAAMRERSFDLALQMHGGGGNSNPFVLRLEAGVSVGLRAGDAPALDIDLPYVYYQSEVMRMLEIVGLVGAAPVTLEPRLGLTPADEAEAQAVMPSGLAPFAVLNPGASDTRRRWPSEKFAAVGDALADQGATIVITGGPEDDELGEGVVQAMRRPSLNLVGRLRLGGLAALLSRSRVIVSNDTGPLHLGAAVGAATVGIYWCGNLINAGPNFRARHRPLLSWQLDCPVCGRNCTREECPHDASFVTDVPVDEVRAAALELFASGGSAFEISKGTPRAADH